MESPPAPAGRGKIAGVHGLGKACNTRPDGLANLLDHPLGHHAGEGDGQPALAQVFGDGEIAGAIAKAFDHVRLEMDGGKIGRTGMPRASKACATASRSMPCGELDHVDEPGHARGGRVRRRTVPRRESRPGARHTTCHLLPLGQQFLDALHLGDAQRGRHLVQAVVVTQVGVLEPGIAGGAALVAQGAHEIGGLVIVGHDDAALAGGDLLVGVKGVDAVIAQAAGLAALVFRAQRLARILDDRQPELVGDPADGVHIGGLAEHIHRQDGLQAAARVGGSRLPGQPFFGLFCRPQTRSRAASARRGISILPVRGSTSTKTGTAFSNRITLVEATKEKGVVSTRSPAWMPAARTHRCSPAVPELTPMACFAPV